VDPAYDGDGEPRDGADVAELTGLLNLTGWLARTRVIARREVPHLGAQLRPVECNGPWITCFATNTSGGQLPDLKLRHRRRARAEDRIRWVKDIGLANLPLHDAASNAVWLAIVLLAYDPAHLDPDAVVIRAAAGPLPVAEPKTLRLRLVAIAGRLTGSGRRTQLRPALALGRHGGRRRSGAARLRRPRLTTPLLPRRPEDPEQRPGATAGNNHTRTRSPVSADNAARNLKSTKDRG
jgi:hypothetical protein